MDPEKKLCIICKVELKTDFFICDNDCGRQYCSSECADKDDNHQCGSDDLGSI